MAVQTQIQWRRGTAASWTSTNPTLAAGEVGLETDTGKFKVGTGSSTWTALAYGTVLPATLTAKGSILAASAASTPAELAVGNNGETLVADSSTSTGLRYQTAANQNCAVNGNTEIWQRGTSFTGLTTYTYTADRWKTILAGTSLNVTVSQDTSIPNSVSKTTLKVTQASGTATSVSEFGIQQIFETSSILTLCGKTTVVSFWYKSNKTGSHYARIYATPMTGGTDVTTAFTVSAADTWEYKTITFASFAGVTTPSTATTAEAAGLQIGFRCFGGGSSTSIAANDYVQIAQVQLEAGNVATSFKRAGGTIQGELAACQRYYWRQSNTGVTARLSIGSASSATQVVYQVFFPQTLRSYPTALEYGGTLNSGDGNTNTVVTSIAMYDPTPYSCMLAAASASGLTTYRPYTLIGSGAGAAYIGFTAEL